MLGQLGHRLPQSARVLLGDEHRQTEDAGAAHEHRGVAGDRVELAHRLPEGLLDVDDDERGAVALEDPAHTVTSSGAPAP